MGRKQIGFSLIELMIVVAIIGIIAAVAIPIYEGNIAKSQIGRAVGELGAYRSAFEAGLSGGAVNNQILGYSPSDLTTGTHLIQIATVHPDGSGHLQVTLGGNALYFLTGVIVRYERSVDGEWGCFLDVSAVDRWRRSYAPEGCRLI